MSKTQEAAKKFQTFSSEGQNGWSIWQTRGLELFGGSARLRSGHMPISKETFEREVLALLGPLHGTARRLTRNDADAEDLVAESVTRAWRSRDSLTDEKAFRAWLFRILHNTFISERRKAMARPQTEMPGEERNEDEQPFSLFDRLQQPFLLWFGNPEQEFLEKLLREDLDRALGSLPEHYRAVVLLSDVEGCTYEEIAQALDIPIGTVRSRLARARSALQVCLWELAQERGLRPRADRPGRVVTDTKGT
jgi:RNA polymerase sigma-70 factor (ECF subfamily)